MKYTVLYSDQANESRCTGLFKERCEASQFMRAMATDELKDDDYSTSEIAELMDDDTIRTESYSFEVVRINDGIIACGTLATAGN